MLKTAYRINEDGSFDILAETGAALKSCYPAIDGRPLRVTGVSCSADAIQYKTKQGIIRIGFTTEDAEVRIKTVLKGYAEPIATFSPIGYAECAALSGVYKASDHLGEDCGWVDPGALRKKGTTRSAALITLGLGSRYLTLYAADYTRYDHYGLITAIGRDNTLTVSSCYTLEKLNRPDEELPLLRIFLGENLEESLNAAAAVIGKTMHGRNKLAPAYHWCSWYYYFHNFDQWQLDENLAGMVDCKMINELNYVQIDEGYCPSIGDWLTPNERWPDGLQTAFDKIKKAGSRPGIWVAPFMVANRSNLYKQHPDWILLKTDGKPLCFWENYNEPKPWGLQDEEYYVLDTSHPDAMAYIRHVFRTLREWGAELFKTDFMLWGYVDSSTVIRHAPGKTSIEYFRELLAAIRSEIGEETYWLGCIAPFLPFIGFADAMRVGGDVASRWQECQNMIGTIIGNNFTNHHYYQTDPDSFFLRDFYIKLADHEVESLTLLAVLSGGALYTSDPVYKLRKDRLELLRYIKPDGRHKPSMPYIEQNREDIVLVHRPANSKKGIVFVFNKSDVPVTAIYPLAELGFAAPMTSYDYKSRDVRGSATDRLVLTTPAHGYQLIFLNADGAAKPDYTRLWNNV